MVTSLRQTRHVPRLPSELHCITISYDGAHGVWSGEAQCVWRDSGLWATSRPAHPRSRISRAKCRRRGTKAASQATVLQTEHDEYAPAEDGGTCDAPEMASPPWTSTSVATKSRTRLRGSGSSPTLFPSSGILLVADILETCWS